MTLTLTLTLDELDVIQAATSKFCICRQSRVGDMVECSVCEEKYHKGCVGINPSAPTPVNYTCMRCLCKQVYSSVTHKLFATVDHWAQPQQEHEAMNGVAHATRGWMGLVRMAVSQSTHPPPHTHTRERIPSTPSTPLA